MLGLVWTPRETDARFAPSTPAPLYPVAGEPAIAHTLDAAFDAGATTLLVAGTTAIEEALEGRYSDETLRVVDHDSVGRVLSERDGDGTSMGMFNGCRLYSPEAVATIFADGTDDSTLHERHPDVRRPWELLEANEAALERVDPAVDGAVASDATLSGPVRVEAGATIREGVVVEGPALIQSGATVGPNAHVRARSLIGPDARVGHSVEVKNSVLFAGATVPHRSYVGDSVVGPDANLGAGTIVANLRHDEAPVRVADGDRRVSTGRRKFGAILGEGVRLGIGTMIDAGVTIGADATTAPGETVTRDRLADGVELRTKR